VEVVPRLLEEAVEDVEEATLLVVEVVLQSVGPAMRDAETKRLRGRESQREVEEKKAKKNGLDVGGEAEVLVGLRDGVTSAVYEGVGCSKVRVSAWSRREEKRQRWDEP
jgi:hypothetical protein